MFAEIRAPQAFARSVSGAFGFLKRETIFCPLVMHGGFWSQGPGGMWPKAGLLLCRVRLGPGTGWAGQAKFSVLSEHLVSTQNGVRS